ncbi:MAG: nucleotidyl transferase [Desulfobacteraceae bacterium CG2_30_51_40]|nr:MAG: nucleotidyl transferase [Desulfobacteraceae bacterium CG2_30_51_40]
MYMQAVVMAGGAGTRFWPVSRRAKPKQFLQITGRQPLLVQTVERLSPLVEEHSIVVVLGEEHLDEAAGLLIGKDIHLLAEPVGRNTAACIGLGALYLGHLGLTGPVAFLPADHYIGDVPGFLRTLEAAARLAEDGSIVTLGIVPSRPETGYGYIKREGGPTDINGESAFQVAEFVEKPDLAAAERYLAEGTYYWNGGIFVARQDVILSEIEEHLPLLSQGLKEIGASIQTDSFDETISRIYQGLPSISFDYGIMENTRRDVKVVESRFGWSDVGSWLSLYELRASEHDLEGNLKEGNPILVDCKKSFIAQRGKRKVACLGLEDCLVIDTADALLVADIRRSQDIKGIVELLKGAGEGNLL